MQSGMHAKQVCLSKIDLCLSLTQLAVFPNVEVRVCQFHAMDAIQRWLNAAHPVPAHPGKGSKSRKTFLVPKEAHTDIQRAFRFTQRCREPQDFATYLNAFNSAIEQVCATHGVSEQSGPICDYFADNFWCADWRGM